MKVLNYVHKLKLKLAGYLMKQENEVRKYQQTIYTTR